METQSNYKETIGFFPMFFFIKNTGRLSQKPNEHTENTDYTEKHGEINTDIIDFQALIKTGNCVFP